MLTGVESIAAVGASQPVMTANTNPLVGPESPLPGVSAGVPTQGQGVTAPDTFANLMQSKLTDLDANVSAAETTLRDLAAGKSIQPHEVMITLERARISVLTFVQLRNKLVESYQDVMRMQL